MRRYGPVHQFWTYSGERLNFVLKSINNNGHGGGEREHTYMMMFRLSQAAYERVSPSLIMGREYFCYLSLSISSHKSHPIQMTS